MGMDGGMMMHGPGAHGTCQRLEQIATFRMEQTPQGAILRFEAKNSAQVEEVRRLAQNFGSCLQAQMKQPGMPPPPPR
jgi:hypothetical protein